MGFQEGKAVLSMEFKNILIRNETIPPAPLLYGSSKLLFSTAVYLTTLEALQYSHQPYG